MNDSPMMDGDDGSGSKGKKLLIGALLLFLIGSLAIYVSGVSLKSLVFRSSSQAEGAEVGLVKKVEGHLKRQPKDSLEFLDAQESASLFNEDTLMTGPSDRALVELFDGTQLELDPGSLIRLSFDTQSQGEGIERKVLVDIVAGSVKGNEIKPRVIVRRAGRAVAPADIAPSTLSSVPRSEPEVVNPAAVQEVPPAMEAPAAEPESSEAPSTEETPLPQETPQESVDAANEAPVEEPAEAPTLSAKSIRIIQPKPGQVFSLTPGLVPPLKQALIFETPTIPDAQVIMLVRNSEGKEVLRRTVSAHSGRGGLLANFARPGRYSLEILNPDGSAIGEGLRARFSVAAEYVGIEAESPLVGGEAVDSNQFTGKPLSQFDVVLRWRPVDGADQYRIVVKRQNGTVLADETVKGASYAFPKGRIHTEPLTYEVRAAFPSGYAAVSKPETFLFNFNSPAQTLPVDGASVSLSSEEVKLQKGVLFSWQRTTFTEAYDFEIAADAGFERVLKRVRLGKKDNFLIFKNLRPSDYWWRVRAVNGNLRSPPRAGVKLTVTP
jgi:hypothetical protein